jgi:aldose 1-epimerase
MEMAGNNFSVSREHEGAVEVIRLADIARKMEVRLAPSVGNIAYSFKVNGKEVLWFPFPGLEALKSHPALCGIPFLAPWANRIDGDTYWVNGKQFRLNPALGNLRRDSVGQPIHGLLIFSPEWRLVAAGADERSVYATSRLEFAKYPEMMAQFPFAHSITMTHRLEEGLLAIETSIRNESLEPMPVGVGFHPYFRLADAPRDDWTVHLAAREHLLLNDRVIPTGERQPAGFSDPHPLRTRPLDDVFSGLVRDADGVARFWVEGKGQRITVAYGPKYPVAVVYAPQGRDFICFEPMAAVTNAFNLAHTGTYKELQTIEPGGQWRETFSIAPSGF